LFSGLTTTEPLADQVLNHPVAEPKSKYADKKKEPPEDCFTHASTSLPFLIGCFKFLDPCFEPIIWAKSWDLCQSTMTFHTILTDNKAAKRIATPDSLDPVSLTFIKFHWVEISMDMVFSKSLRNPSQYCERGLPGPHSLGKLWASLS